MVDHLMKAYAKDIYIQMFGPEQTNATGWKWLAKEVLPGEVYKDHNVRTTVIRTIMALGIIRMPTASSPSNRMEA